MPSLLGKLLNKTPVPMTGPLKTSFLTTNLMSLGSDADSNLRAYANQGTVHANVSLLASSTAKPAWKLFVKDKTDGRSRYSTASTGSDQRVERTTHAALNVLNRPAVFKAPSGRELVAWSRFGLFEISGIWLEALGKSAWVVDFGKVNFPVGLWPVRPDRISPVPDPVNYLKGYVYTAPDSSEKIPLAPEEVIWNRYPNPSDPYDGMGPVQSVMTEIEGIRYAGEWNRNFFLNSARPDGVLSADHKIEDDEWDELSDRWRESHRGVGRAHRIAVLEGVTWQPIGLSAKDMDFNNLRRDARDAIRESMGMHKVMTGVTEDVNRANAQTGEEVFANWKIVPRLDRWRDVLNYQYLPLFYPSGADIPYEFDYIYPLPANREQDDAELTAKSTAAQKLIQSGYEPHAVLEVVGLPDMETVEVATQAPALPPSWVAEPQQAAPASSDTDGSDDTAAANNRMQVVIRAAKDTQAKVIKQLSLDYPAKAYAWAHHATWTGPVPLPEGHINVDPLHLKNTRPAHVQDFIDELKKGKKLKPLIAVKTPGSDKPELIDGAHRYMAAVEESVPIRAWIATVDKEHGPWETMHDQQIDMPGPTSARKLTTTKSNSALLSKASVNYRDATGDHKCGNCAMFHAATRTCDIVAGNIEPGEVCDRWTAADMTARLQKVLSNGHDPVDIEPLLGRR